MAIDVYNTHIEVYPYIKGDCPLIEDMFTAIDKFSDKTYPCGYMIENNKLYLPSAMNIPKLENLIGEKAIRKRYCDPYDEMSVEHESYVESRDDIQERAVEFLCGKDKQMSLTLATGMGKTVCVCMSLTNLNIKTINSIAITYTIKIEIHLALFLISFNFDLLNSPSNFLHGK